MSLQFHFARKAVVSPPSRVHISTCIFLRIYVLYITHTHVQTYIIYNSNFSVISIKQNNGAQNHYIQFYNIMEAWPTESNICLKVYKN